MKRSVSANSSNADGQTQNDLSDEQSKLEPGDGVDIETENVGLKKTISFTGACAILLSNVGGASIFITPTTVLFYTGSQGMALILWTMGGVIQLGMALTVTELALIFPKAGGPYYYIYQTFGKLAGFVFLWGFVIFIAGSVWAINSYACSLYILSMIWTDCPPPDSLALVIATFIMVTLMVLNCTYMKVVTCIQKFLTSGKVLALLIVIIVGFSYIRTDSAKENLGRMMEGTHGDIGRLSLALFSGFYSFGGWQLLTILIEEIKNPVKVVPASMITSFFILISTIVTSIFSYGILLSKEDMLKSDAIAVQFGSAVHPAIKWCLSILVNVVNIGSLNVLIMGQPRMLYAAGLNNQMPKMMTLMHRKFETPWPATMTMGILGFIMLQRGSIMSLVDTISLYAGFMSVLVLGCLLYLRWKRPDLPRPFKVPLIFPILLFALSLALIVLAVVTKPRELGIVVLVVLLGVPIYYICIVWQKPARLFNYVDVFTKYLKLSLDLV